MAANRFYGLTTQIHMRHNILKNVAIYSDLWDT